MTTSEVAETTEVYSLTVLEARNLKSRCRQHPVPPEVSGGRLRPGCWQSLGFLGLWQHKCNLGLPFSQPSPLCICVLPNLSHKDMSLDLGPTLTHQNLILTRLHLQKPYFQVRSHLPFTGDQDLNISSRRAQFSPQPTSHSPQQYLALYFNCFLYNLKTETDFHKDPHQS